MRYPYLVVAGALAVGLASARPAITTLSAQGRGGRGGAPPDAAQGGRGGGRGQGAAPAPTAPYAPSTYTPPKSAYVPSKTPWGDPDLQGVYDFQTIVRMQRPAALAGKKTLTDDELREYAKNNTPNEDACGFGSKADEQCSPEQLADVGDYNDFWDNRNFVKDNRTALIEDPDDGKIPPMTPEGQKKQQAFNAERRAPGRPQLGTWEDFSGVTRCIAEQTPNGPQMYNSGTYIMQSPGWVLLVRERLDTRVIALDGRPHVGASLRSWQGDSRGHWEGNTLVVETTNFTGKQIMGGVGSTIPAGINLENVKLTERWVPVAANRIYYYATIDDSTTWSRPWTFMLPWQKDPTYTIYEYACHEGNISVGNALRGERMLELKSQEAQAAPAANLTSSLIGSNDAAVRTKLGEPNEILGPRWSYQSVAGNPVYVFFEQGKVKLVAPNDLPLDQVKKR